MNSIFLIPLEDLLTVIFWAITYILICISAFKSIKVKKIAMPYLAGVLNFSWEINALLAKQGLWIYVLWFSIDLLIIGFSVYFLDSFKKKVFYIVSIILTTIILKYIFSLNQGMMLSVFTIDIIMAVWYVTSIKSLSPFFKKSIAITRFIGDLFAGVVGIKYSKSYILFPIIVAILNIIYIWNCFSKNNDKIKIK